MLIKKDFMVKGKKKINCVVEYLDADDPEDDGFIDGDTKIVGTPFKSFSFGMGNNPINSTTPAQLQIKLKQIIPQASLQQ